MLNIISSEFYKIIKSKVSISVLTILLLMFSIVVISSAHHDLFLTGILSYQQSYGGDFTYYIILIFTTSLITAEYTNGTIRQMTCRGISRWKLVLGQYISLYISITTILVLFSILNLMLGTVFNSLGEVDLVKFFNMNIGILCMIFGATGIGVFISYLFKNTGIATFIAIFIVLCSNFFSSILSLITENDIFIKYSFSSMRKIIIDLSSNTTDVMKCSIIFFLIGVITLIGSALLFSKTDIN